MTVLVIHVHTGHTDIFPTGFINYENPTTTKSEVTNRFHDRHHYGRLSELFTLYHGATQGLTVTSCVKGRMRPGFRIHDLFLSPSHVTVLLSR